MCDRTIVRKTPGFNLTSRKCLHVPKPKSDHVSSDETAKKGCSTEFLVEKKIVVVQRVDIVLAGTLTDGLMELDIKPVSPKKDIETGNLSFIQPVAHLAKANGLLRHSYLVHMS